jgi:hypothetical protein
MEVDAMITRKTILAVAAAAMFAVPPAGAHEQLSDEQLDRLTAGAIALGGIAGADATGVWTQTTSATQSVGGRANGPHVFFEEMGIVSANSAANGSNLAVQGATPPTSDARAATGGVADGSYVHNQQVYHQLSVGGMTGVVTWRVIYSTLFLGI